MNAPESALLESMPAAETGAVCAVTGNVEAARYALFSRIVPVLLHGLVGDLQAMRFAVSLARLSCETAESREKILGAIARIGEQTNAAVVRGQAFADWLRPDTDAKTIVHEAVRANLDLIATEWSLRGIEVTTDDAAAIQVVGAAMCREMLSAMLVTLGDSLPGAADVKLRLRQRAGVVVVSLHGRAAAREGDRVRGSLSRALHWNDVASLADSHGVACVQRGDHVIAWIPVRQEIRPEDIDG
ncbi:MAG TPA: hypothetical protein VGA44_05770 [Steroidobacteraceae bacterium]